MIRNSFLPRGNKAPSAESAAKSEIEKFEAIAERLLEEFLEQKKRSTFWKVGFGQN